MKSIGLLRLRVGDVVPLPCTPASPRQKLKSPYWIVACTEPGRERRALRDLDRLGFRSLRLFDKVRKLRKRGNEVIPTWVDKPFLGPYLPIQIRFADESIKDIEAAEGIAGVVRTAIKREPVVLADAVIEELRDRCLVRFGEEDREWVAGLVREIIAGDSQNAIVYREEGRRRLSIESV